MAHKDQFNEELTPRDIKRFSSTLEDVDFAVYNFVKDRLDLKTNTNKGFKNVPIVWAGSERAHNIKNDDLERDLTGQVTLPIISIERVSVKKNKESRLVPHAMIDPIGDNKGAYITVNKVIKQDKTSNFANADAARRHKQENFPTYRNKKNKKIVYETITIPIPIYVDVGYKIVFRTEYQEQMNDMLTPIITVSNAHRKVYIKNESNIYEAFIGEDYALSNNVSSYETNERKYETEISMNVNGYIIGDGNNQVQPRVVRRENAVQIRFARERIIVQDEEGEFRF